MIIYILNFIFYVLYIIFSYQKIVKCGTLEKGTYFPFSHKSVKFGGECGLSFIFVLFA